MRFFIAGIIQGSKAETDIHGQKYRTELKELLLKAFPDANVYDPFENHKDSLSYAPELGKKVFLTHNALCGKEIDVLIAFVPEATMGTAIEIWEAWKNNATTIVISPLATNWVVKFLSDAVYPDVGSFERALASGEIARLLEARGERVSPRKYEIFELPK